MDNIKGQTLLWTIFDGVLKNINFIFDFKRDNISSVDNLSTLRLQEN